MTTKRRILSLVLVMLMLLFSCVAVSCTNTQGNEQNTGDNNEPTKTEWPEAGVYYFDDVNYENTLTLNVGGTFSLYLKGELSAAQQRCNGVCVC